MTGPREKILCLFGIALLILGCISPSEDKTLNESTIEGPVGNETEVSPPSEKSFAAVDFIDKRISSCKVISDSEIESLYSLNGKSVSHLGSLLDLDSVVVSTCTYESMEQEYYTLKIKTAIYTDKSTYSGFEDMIKDNDYSSSGNIEGLEYVYFDESKTLDVFLPDDNYIVEFWTQNFPNADEDTLLRTAELFLSRTDFKAESKHSMTVPSAQKKTYTGKYITMQYPANWAVNEIYDPADDRITLEDKDGITLMLIGTGSAHNPVNQTVFEEHKDTLASMNLTLLDSYYGEDDSLPFYWVITKQNTSVSIFYIAEGETGGTIAVLGTIDEYRYTPYENDIISVLGSISEK